MRVMEKLILPSGTVLRRLPLGASADDMECLLSSMRKHVQRDGSVSSLFVEYENARVPITHENELLIIAQLATAYNQSLTAQQWASEKDLYGRPYAPGEEELDSQDQPEAAVTHAAKPANNSKQNPHKNFKNAVEGDKDAFRAVNSRGRARAVSKRNTPKPAEEWDAEKNGDRFIYDPHYEQNEELVPWNKPGNEEKFSWYM